MSFLIWAQRNQEPNWQRSQIEDIMHKGQESQHLKNTDRGKSRSSVNRILISNEMSNYFRLQNKHKNTPLSL